MSRDRPEAPRVDNEESFVQKSKRMTTNCCRATGLCCFTAKEQSQVSLLEYKITQRQKKFGVDYLTLMLDQKVGQEKMDRCLDEAEADIAELREGIHEHRSKMLDRAEQVHSKIDHGTSTTGLPPPKISSKKADKDPSSPSSRKKQKAQKKHGQTEEPEQSSTKTPTGSGKVAPRSSSAKSTASPTKKTNAASKKPIATKPNSPAKRPPAVNEEEDPFLNADPSKWKCLEQKFAGSAAYEKIGKREVMKGKSIARGVKNFKANPKKYFAMTYQTSMLDWPDAQQEYTLIHRDGTLGYKPQAVSKKGWMTVLLHEYETLPPFKDNQLPKQYRDKYTDAMTFCRRKLHSNSNPPILPGRGMGVCDAPNIKIIGDVDPSDIHQGQVGNCWMLSGISSLAEFDGAVKKLFRKTNDLDKMPWDSKPNIYTITLWDLKSWKEVDIEIDERLCASPHGDGKLLASKPSIDGELWVCYLEKALAIHCGGWDKIVGGQCTHAWALMTGCKEQYMISKNKKTGNYTCSGRYNRLNRSLKRHGNSPHDGDQGMFHVPWPEVGGGGSMELNKDELFRRMVAWDQTNYIVGAGTSGVSDKNSTEGMVDNHAYSVIESISGVAGTNIDLVKVRNPWGKGEIEDGEFDDDGPGWDKYPQIKRLLNPVVADDGIFWVTKDEFFKFFQTIYLSASDMTEFLED